MAALVRIIGIVVVVMGIVFALSPKMMKQALAFFKEGKRIYAAGIIRVLIGILLLSSSTQCKLVWVVFVLGILLVIAGTLVFVIGLERCRAIIDHFSRKPDMALRLIALVPIVLGILLICSA